MTVRRRRSTGRTPAEIGSRLPQGLHQLPTVDPSASSEALVNRYRDYTEELQAGVLVETGRFDQSLTLAVAGALGTDPAAFYRAVYR